VVGSEAVVDSVVEEDSEVAVFAVVDLVVGVVMVDQVGDHLEEQEPLE
jgi:hypothetical protein